MTGRLGRIGQKYVTYAQDISPRTPLTTRTRVTRIFLPHLPRHSHKSLKPILFSQQTISEVLPRYGAEVGKLPRFSKNVDVGVRAAAR